MASFEILVRGMNIRPKIGFFGYASIMLIKNGNETILCDTGSHGLRNFIIGLRKKIKIDKVFISHLHFDHAGNIDLFDDTPIYINQREIDAIVNKEIDDGSVYMPVKDFLINAKNIITFDDTMEISRDVKTILTPGHSVGHSSIGFLNKNNERVVFCGDAIKSMQDYLLQYNGNQGVDHELAVSSVKTLKDNFDILITGHSGIIRHGFPDDQTVEFELF